MKLNDVGKLAFLLAVLVVTGTLAALKVVEGSLVEVVILVELGYVTGNGVLATRKQKPSPILTHTDDDPLDQGGRRQGPRPVRAHRRRSSRRRR